MIQVLGLQKEVGSDPQVFTLYLKDEEKEQTGYIWTTETGTEEVLRGALAKGGMPEPKIDEMFARAEESCINRDMVKGEYGVYCADCEAFIRFNSYSDYRPTFFPAEGGETWPCPSCRNVTTYTADRIVYRENGRDFPALS